MKRHYEVENDFFYRGQRCLVLKGDWRCGYVGIKPTHPLYGIEYNDNGPDFDQPCPEDLLRCHGGITYSGNSRLSKDDGVWWFGFDTAHSFDQGIGGRSLEYVTDEVIKLADQLADLEVPK